MHYYQHHIGDFIKATSRLSDGQAMGYLRLLWLYYDKDGNVEHDVAQIAFEVGSDAETVALIIKTYFDVEGGFIKQTRCDKEIQGYLRKSEGGKVGAKNRWSNESQHGLPIANPLGNPMPTQCEPNATPVLTNNQEPITKNHKKNTNTDTAPEGVSSQVFQDFLVLRKGLKAPVSETALKNLRIEGDKANLSLEEVMSLCCQNGWRGFKAEWVKDKHSQKTLKSFRQIDDEISKKRYNEMVGTARTLPVAITVDNFLEME